ncbi:hypothetical protein BGZ70_010691, partial [Mortierella alpina]
MIPAGAAHTVIATPELALLVFAHLTPYDRVQCIRVCKAWACHLEPLHWADFCPATCFDTKGLLRNLPFIRTVNLNPEFTGVSELAHGLPRISKSSESSETAVDLNTLCTHLRQFKLQYRCFEETSHLVILLNHNRFLTHLTLPDVSWNLGIYKVISRLRHLQHLAVEAPTESSGRQPTLFLLLACLALPDLTELILDYTVLWDSKDDENFGYSKLPNLEGGGLRLDVETIIQESVVARFSENPSASKIKLLHLPHCSGVGMNPFVLPLLASGLLNLESCSIPWVSHCPARWDVEKEVLEHCPRLKHLTYGGGMGYSDYELVRAFIRGSLRLEGFTSSFFGSENKYGDEEVIQDLVAHHCNTLREVEFTECRRLSSRGQQAILSRCKQLRRFWVMSAYPEGSSGIRFTDISRSDWVCLELRELRLTLNRHFDVNNGYDDESDQEDLEADDIENLYAIIGYESLVSDADLRRLDQAAKRVYTQIGRLSKLEKLTLDIDRSHDTEAEERDYQWELTLSKGKLGELADLKQLKSLRLEADFWTRMGQAEVEFMHERWPLLEEIILCGK